MTATISVVIPVKDDAGMLDACLTALQAQTRPALEIVVVDNGSTDDTVAVARRHGATVVSEQRPGITAAAARGYDAAGGDIIARCDADSLVPPTWLEQMERTLDSRPAAAAVTGPARFYDLSRPADLLARIFYLETYFLLVGAAVANVPLFGSNFAMRRAVWERAGPGVPRDNADLHDDFDLSYRIPPQQRVILDRELVVGISGRPFRDPSAFAKRLRRAGVTLREHLPAELPHRRWAARWRAR